MNRKGPFSIILVCLLTLTPLACGESKDPLDPGTLSMELMAGTYVATDNFGAISFTTTESGKTVDWLAAGATLEVSLAADGSTSGRLFVPGMHEDGGDFDADLTGTWTLKGDTIRFSHPADTFVRDMPFLVRDTELRGDRSFSGVRVKVTLVRK